MYSAIDLFSGAGGLSLGLMSAGFSVMAAVENDAVAAQTYRHNFPHALIEKPIEILDPSAVMAMAGLAPGECDLLAGGPPCQGFSVQRRGGDHDLRNHMVLEFLRFVEGIRPRFFLMENVKGLMSKRGSSYYQRVVSRAEELGYRVCSAKLDAAHFGVPQHRVRVFLIGEYGVPDSDPGFTFPTILRDESNFRTVRQAIGDMPSPPKDGSPHPDYPLHYREARLSKINLERLGHIPEGGGRDDLPPHLQLPCHINNPSHRHKDVYGRLAWDIPAGTLTARFDSFSRGRFGHPVEARTITLREGARLQTFPDSFHFLGNREGVARQIGNAVPPELAEIIARAIMCRLQRPRSVSRQSASAPRRQLHFVNIAG